MDALPGSTVFFSFNGQQQRGGPSDPRWSSDARDLVALEFNPPILQVKSIQGDICFHSPLRNWNACPKSCLRGTRGLVAQVRTLNSSVWGHAWACAAAVGAGWVGPGPGAHGTKAQVCVPGGSSPSLADQGLGRRAPGRRVQ